MYLPFISDIQEIKEENSILSFVSLGTEHYPFLSHHAFNKQIIIPAVVFLEIFAENAKRLFPELSIYHIEKAEFNSFLSMRQDESVDVFCSLQVDKSQVIEGQLYHYFENKLANVKRKKIIATMRANLSKHPVKSSNKQDIPFFPFSDTVIDKRDIYPDLVGLGKSFNHLSSVLQMSSDHGAIGKLIRNSIDLNIDINSLILGNLLLRDSSYHLASIWGNHFIGGFNVPFAMYDIYIHDRMEDNEYFSVIKPLGKDGVGQSYSLFIIDLSGRIIEEYQKILYTHNVTVSENTNREAIEQRKQNIIELKHLSHELYKDLDYAGIWSTAFVKQNEREFLVYLNHEEIVIYEKYTRQSSRLEYLGARVLVKLLLIKAIKDKYHRDISFNDISILRDNNGLAILLIRGKTYDNISISLSHKKDYVFVALQFNSKLGVDVEELSEKLIRVSSKYIDDSEMLLLREAFPGHHRHNPSLEAYAMLWSSKESLVKALNGRYPLLEIGRTAKLYSVNDNTLKLKCQLDNTDITVQTKSFPYQNHIFTWLTKP
ncbi:MAG: polyketide synthase dehydratase domain-containing protein [Spirochaetota bacterium]|nr:polyketide synthase dehydratase domain-containing protein [Spirochaetota bacterium]